MKSWFENWENDLLELGFAGIGENGEVKIPKNQLERVLNIDETCRALDGGSGQRGGACSNHIC